MPTKNFLWSFWTAKFLRNQTKWIKESFYLKLKRKGKRIPFSANDILNCLADIIICNTMVCFISYFIISFFKLQKNTISLTQKYQEIYESNWLNWWYDVPLLPRSFLFLNTKMSGRWRMNTNVISAKDPFYFFCYGYRDKPTEFQASPLTYFYSASF